VPKVTYIYTKTSAGVETDSDQLKGTAVTFAGSGGRVRACAFSGLKTTTFLLKGRESGREVIPNGSAPQGLIAVATGTTSKIDAQDFIYEADVKPREPLELTITFAAVDVAFVGVQTE
jgi:hypothetical protein